jgi:HD superfamily phosphohydrolase
MEIRDPLHGTLVFNEGETRVIESPEFQRLRAIKQLGFAEFSFPGATHNRFLHSLGVSHVATLAFDQIFKHCPELPRKKIEAFRQVTRLAALLHDVGHGPLSHTTEDVMPPLRELHIPAYRFKKPSKGQLSISQSSQVPEGQVERASHEDYTIKYITDSPLSRVIEKEFVDFQPYHIALLIDRSLSEQDDFFVHAGLNWRPLLSSLISSELDADRMDYLERDSYFCGTNYGKVDFHWILSHMTYHTEGQDVHLALHRRALYTFDDFLLARHHMHLMVYFHHKSIIYEEFLNRFILSPDCHFRLPADIEAYTQYNDYKLFEAIAASSNPWAQRIAKKQLYKVLLEMHSSGDESKSHTLYQDLKQEGFEVILASSQARLSKYHSIHPDEHSPTIFVVDLRNRWDKPTPIDEATEIFHRYEGARVINRLYVPPEQVEKAKAFLEKRKM